MNTRLVLAVLRMRRQHRPRERWSRSQLEAFQASSLTELRRFAMTQSAFYRRVHRGLESSSVFPFENGKSYRSRIRSASSSRILAPASTTQRSPRSYETS
jgi:hypothetical protein